MSPISRDSRENSINAPSLVGKLKNVAKRVLKLERTRPEKPQNSIPRREDFTTLKELTERYPPHPPRVDFRTHGSYSTEDDDDLAYESDYEGEGFEDYLKSNGTMLVDITTKDIHGRIHFWRNVKIDGPGCPDAERSRGGDPGVPYGRSPSYYPEHHESFSIGGPEDLRKFQEFQRPRGPQAPRAPRGPEDVREFQEFQRPRVPQAPQAPPGPPGPRQRWDREDIGYPRSKEQRYYTYDYDDANRVIKHELCLDSRFISALHNIGDNLGDYHDASGNTPNLTEHTRNLLRGKYIYIYICCLMRTTR